MPKEIGHLSALDVVAEAVEEHNKLDASPMYRCFFGFLDLGNTKRRGTDTSGQKETI